MSKLRKFKKIEETNKKNAIKVVGVFVVIGILLIGTSYAVYQKEEEKTFINAKVRFPKASEVTYTTTSNSSVKTVEQALNDLYGKLGK